MTQVTMYVPSQPFLVGSSYAFSAFLFQRINSQLIQTSPTIVAGDIKISKDGGGYSNITNLPIEVGTSGELIVTLTSAETTSISKYITVKFSDVSGEQWCDSIYVIEPDSPKIINLDNLDVAVSTRAIPGSSMNLTSTAVDNVWDEILTGATHNIPTSAGRRLRQIASTIVISGMSQGSGTNGNQIVLDSEASSIDGAYDPALIAIVNGNGSGQCRLILQYEGITKLATVDRSWKVNPDLTSEYIIYADPGREHVNEGLAQGGGANTITLNASASSINNEYVGQTVFIRSGHGEDQACKVISYNGATKVATVGKFWGEIPDSTSAYVMLPTGILDTTTLTSNIVSGVWNNSERTLTSSSGGGATASEIWSYENRTLTNWKTIVSDIWNAIPIWFLRKIEVMMEPGIFIYKGISNNIPIIGSGNVKGASNIIFTIKNSYQDLDSDSILRIEFMRGLVILNGETYPDSTNGEITIIDELDGSINITIHSKASALLIPSQKRLYDVVSKIGDEVRLVARGKIDILPDVTNSI